MSLIKQLWIAILITSLTSLGGSFVVSTWSARAYMVQELGIKNMDNARSLALSLSQLPKDPVSVELLIAAQFDTGHYRRISLLAPDGSPIVERSFDDGRSRAPAWFVALIPLHIPAGVAQVQDGWQQYGSLSVETHVRYAHDALWSATSQLLLWFAGAALLVGLLSTLMLKRITRPLGSVVAQAEAISARRFVTTTPPRTQEFRRVVEAMNTLSERVRTMLGEEAQRLQQLRHQTQHDTLTGLLRRAPFLKHLDTALSDDSSEAGGLFCIFRCSGIAELNRDLGRPHTDEALRELAARLQALCAPHPQWLCGRLNATEFGLLAPGLASIDAVTAFVDGLQDSHKLPAAFKAQLHSAGVHYETGDEAAGILIRIDGSLAHAEEEKLHTPQLAPHQPALYHNREQWRTALTAALAANQLQLARFPVLDAGLQHCLHHEAPVRLLLDGEWRSAGQFLPWAARLGLLGRIDSAVLAAACSQLAAEPELPGLAINLSDEAVSSYAFHAELLARLQTRPEIARRLWLDVLESSALRHPAAFRALALSLRPLGCRLGLKHAGRHFSTLQGLHDLGLDYLKISASFNTGHSADHSFLRGLCTLLHSIGIAAIAEQVATPQEAARFAELGLDGVSVCGELAAALAQQ